MENVRRCVEGDVAGGCSWKEVLCAGGGTSAGIAGGSLS